MGYSLSASPRPIPTSQGRQRTALLLASVALHAAILIPIALNTVFVPSFVDDNSFEVWLDMRPPEPLVTPPPRPKPVPRDRTEPQADILPEPPLEQPVERPVERPIERLVEQIRNQAQQTPLERADRSLPQVQQQRPQDTQSMDDAAPGAISDLDTTALPNVTARITRPRIEAIDGPASQAVNDLQNRSLPSVVEGQNREAEQVGQSQSADQSLDQAGALDAPIPRRARVDEETEAALAAAAAGGALDDAWTYRPEGGGAPPAGGGSPAGGSSGAGGVAGNTATQGRIYYGRSTPLDCTQPQMLSDIQRLSCDSADARRIRESIERGRRVMGTGNAERDARNSAKGSQQLYDYQRRRAPLNSGVGVSNGSIQGGSGQGEALDELSGTNREIRKLQDQIGASNGPRAPAPSPASSTPPRS
ncbi:hypothetical protein [Brevundimonas sp.]|uniref:hypothetical protein n=2 Tax=Brevundimonas sp. TaxID=1871086 RepID=UPI002FC62D92